MNTAVTRASKKRSDRVSHVVCNKEGICSKEGPTKWEDALLLETMS